MLYELRMVLTILAELITPTEYMGSIGIGSDEQEILAVT